MRRVIRLWFRVQLGKLQSNELFRFRAEVIAKIEKSALAAYKHREENRKELQSLNSKINNMITCMRKEDPDYEYYAAKNPDLAILLARKNYLDTVMKAGK